MAQINLTGSVGVPGSEAILGNFNVVFTTDANHTLAANEFSNQFLDVTSNVMLTLTRQLIAPLNQGQEFIVQNNTTGGQIIQVIGLSGSGVMVPNGATYQVVCDGSNYIQSATSGVPTGPAGGDLSGSYPNPSVATSGGNTIITNVSTAGGNLSGTYPNPVVAAINGVTLSGTPSSGQVLTATASNMAHWATAASGFTAGGDLSGSSTNQTVIGLQTNPVHHDTLGASQDGYVLTWDNADGYWKAENVGSGSVILAGDVTGAASSNTVVKLYNNPLANTSPVNSAVPVWDSSIYDIRQLTQDDIAPGFTISSFAGGSTVECGATVTNPAFTASYSSLPASAQITNTDGTDSPHVLSTPFTSGTISGSFSKSTVNAAVTFTLSAVKGTVTKTATQNITFEARSFGGLGTAGASSATASGTSAILNASHGTLTTLGLHSTDVGQVYGPFSPSSQNIYLLLPHTSSPHTFKDQNGFTFVMNSPTNFTFSNVNSASISMDLYQSTLVLSTSFTITVTS